MNTFVILPDQLFSDVSVLEFLKDFDKIIIAEDPAYFKSASEGKITLIRACMKSYYAYLEEQLPILTKREGSGRSNSHQESKVAPKLAYIDVAKILPRGDIFEYLTGSRTQVHMFRIAACYTWGNKPWDSTYYGLTIKFHESPGFLVPYCEIKYGDIFIAGSTRINKTGGLEASGVSFGEFIHRFFKIATDNCDTKDSTRYDPAASKIVTALPQSISANSTVSGFKKSHNIVSVEEFSYEVSCNVSSKTPKSTNLRTAAKKYAKETFTTINKYKPEKTPRKVGSNPEIITRVNSHDLSAVLSQQKAVTLPDVKLSRAQSVVGGINKMAKNAKHENTKIVTTKLENSKTTKIIPEFNTTTLLKHELQCKNYPVTTLEANKLSIAFMNKFVRDYATYPSGAILELMFPLNMGLITPQTLLTHVISVFGPQSKKNILLFLRDLLYREYLRCIYITDAQFGDMSYGGINLEMASTAQRSVGLGDNLEKISICELTKLKKIKLIKKRPK